ncbi:phage tail assembly chaperone [Aeromonas veronii]|uniref:phage tail assembly chaperone n=1 Tax=Aeromonas veronii TaxID=654 RepID=UPI002853130D|nr:phage tail assembly chaperone [Aeromonas veronii]MDR5013500.1 phage tail assembly chaperone [Aeromonas veronii]
MIDWSQVVTVKDQIHHRAKVLRANRDAILASSMWIVERHRGQVELAGETSITHHQYKELLSYHQTLRDLPSQPGWPDIEIPSAPTWLAAI